MRTQVTCIYGGPKAKIVTHTFPNIKDARQFKKELNDIYEGKVTIEIGKATKKKK